MLQFDEFQEKEILKGKEKSLDTSVYANPNFSAEKMWYIRNLMERGVDYTPLLSVGDESKLNELYKKLKHSNK